MEPRRESDTKKIRAGTEEKYKNSLSREGMEKGESSTLYVREAG